ncbi:MAG: CoB--CoM heterodisulfide reductase iron-sulfur subunit B family protein [Candidatus Bathyarchaeota archaeon]
MSEKKYLLFLGCTVPYRENSYEISARKVLSGLGVELVEMPEFNCCGLPVDGVSHDLMLGLSARNILLAEREGLNILALCNGCFSTLNKTNKMLKEDKEVREKTKFLEGNSAKFNGTIEVKHLIHVLSEDVGFDRIKNAVKQPLNKMSVPQHSGCHLLRPAKYVGKDDPENPELLKNLIKLTGAECLNYMGETDCCANPIIGLNEEIPFQVAHEKLKNVKAVGAQALITVCPFCHIMYDTNQSRIERTFNEKYGMPVLYYTQLLGLAMGFTPDELGINELRVRPTFL